MSKGKKNIIYLFLYITVSLLISCKKHNSVTINLKNELEKNKTLLERVDQYPELKAALNHYSDPKDSLKRKAMHFLIANLDNKKGLTKIADNEIVSIYKKMYISSMSDTFDFRKKYQYPPVFNTTEISDSDLIKAKDLIENVDLAFEAYKFPWAKKVPFNDFCQYILPHRILGEPFSNWRAFFFHKNKSLVKYLLKNKIEDPEVVCRILNDSLIKQFKFYSKLELPCPNLISLDKNPIGLCMPRYLLYTALARSIGLPVALDFIPQFGNFGGSHYWVTLIQKKNFSFNAGEKWEPCLFRGVKYFRHVYTNNLRGSDKSPLENPNVIDVTKQYQERKIGNLKLELNTTVSKDLYLFTFGMSKEFVCLQKAEIHHKKIFFNDISYFDDSILFIGYYKGAEIIPVENPFKIHNWTREISYMFPSKSFVQTIRLFRKFPISFEEGNFYKEVAGAKIQGSNFKNFKDKKDIFTFKDYPQNDNKVKLNSQYDFNYYRYLPNESGQVNLAELQFIFDNEKDQLNESKYYQFDPKFKNISNLFDNDSRTYYFSSSKENWIGIDRSQSKIKKIKAIKIVARNTYNFIEKNNTYELFYFDFGWKSLGAKKAKDSFINFQNVPANSVLLLKNLSEGYQERIFTYEIYNTVTPKQVFW
ncbi:hypothetical protein C8C83_4450 [Flavobacterium sp. 90]|nr:hypothetical protein C8C83_4450 [Flavobacterium sp. 90]